MAAGAFALERKICQADDPIHGRTDFVAHGGEELALGTGGFQGFLLAFEQFGIAGREFPPCASAPALQVQRRAGGYRAPLVCGRGCR